MPKDHPDDQNHVYSKEEIQQFKDDPEMYYQLRRELEIDANVRESPLPSSLDD